MKLIFGKDGRFQKGTHGPTYGKYKIDAPYRQLHKWIRRNYGSADHCENVDCSGMSRFYDWAKLPRRKYNHNINNYIQLCRKCHRAMDVLGVTINYAIQIR